MRVKKPKSKRTTTRMREGIKKKSAAKRRKDKKLEKKNVQWKSRHPKDLGIPSSFPYKDQILMEIEEKKRIKQEETEARKARIRAEREAQRGDEMVDEAEEEAEYKQDSMAALMESAQQAAAEYNGEQETDEMDEDEYEINDTEVGDGFEFQDIDKSRKQFDKIFRSVVDTSDVVLYVLDARDPEATRSRRVEEAVLENDRKRLILLLNKVDLVPEDALKKWVRHLNKSFPTVPIKASPGGSAHYNKALTQASTAGQLMQALKRYAQKSNLGRAITVGIIGYPNVGKSSVINALTSRHAKAGRPNKICPVGNEAGVTRSLREVKVDNKLKVLDSPGIVFPSKGSGKSRLNATLALFDAIPRKDVQDPELAIKELIRKLAKDKEMSSLFGEYYKLPALPQYDLDEFVKQVLIHVARKTGRLGRGGIPNLQSAAWSILDDWRDGRVTGWTLPKEETEEQPESVDEPKQTEEPATEESKLIVGEWAKEFDLGGLLDGF